MNSLVIMALGWLTTNFSNNPKSIFSNFLPQGPIGTIMRLRSEAVANGITMELLQSKLHEESMERKMDGMKKAYTKAHQLRKEKRTHTKVKINQEMADQDSAKRIRHDLELLDEVIQRGCNNNLCKMDIITPVMALKAIELKHNQRVYPRGLMARNTSAYGTCNTGILRIHWFR
ncbi:hypothetical protein [Paenibacillus sp. JNUCC31]|uniref:hypothetical protein n=1 Tax=Paenibacillus sp. JNUCC-31 TaxID=2777983 RepID=UPI001E37E8E5|nr:hypothetical protein [Paenibacillus sp. JNUCC-31]